MRINIAGFSVKVDAADVDFIKSTGPWFATVSKDQYVYFWRETKATSGLKTERLHRVLTNCPKGLVVDHINGDTLDNRRKNLRVCTNSQNLCNAKKRCDGKSKYKGVKVVSPTCFQAYIKHEGKMLYLGGFKTEKEAHAAYSRAARKYHGEFARLA